MSDPARPRALLSQDPNDDPCRIDGREYGWLNCTCNSAAHGIDKSTIGKKQPTPCSVRRMTGDTSGGTTIPQVAKVCRQLGVGVEERVGSNVISPRSLAVAIQSGRGAIIQLNTRLLLPTKWRSVGGDIPHAVWLNAAYGGTVGHPDEIGVYDSCANGRHASWGHADKGPSRWPWGLVIRAAQDLHIYGQQDPRTLHSLGIDGVYALLFPDTDPHYHPHFGATATDPLPDRIRIDRDAVWSHSSPAYGRSTRVRHLQRDTLFLAYQKVTRNGRLWLGDHLGEEWLPGGKVRNIGGAQ
jgi:hypothetical protein